MPNAEFVCTVYADRAATSTDGWSDPEITVPNSSFVFGSDGWATFADSGRWRQYPQDEGWEFGFNGSWNWSPGKLIYGYDNNATFVRDAANPVIRPTTALQWRISFTIKNTNAYAWRIAWGLVFGATAYAVQTGNDNVTNETFLLDGPDDEYPGYPGQTVNAGQTLHVDYEWSETPIDERFVYFSPYMFMTGDGVEIYDVNVSYRTEFPWDFTCLVDSVDIQHGRDDADTQPDAPAATFALDLPNGVFPGWPPLLDIGAVVSVDALTGDATESRRFIGRVTDLNLAWNDEGEDTPDAGNGQMIATGFTADVGRRVIGDVPWPQESDGTRAARILSAAGAGFNPALSDPGTVKVLPLDVDAQAALDLLHELAESASGIVWENRAGDVLYADAWHRRGTPVSLELDACQVDVSPTWRRTLEGLVNSVSIGYGPTPEEGEQARYRAVDGPSIGEYGTYGASISTQLAARADAVKFANLLLARNAEPVWLFVSLPLDIPGLTDDEYESVLSLDMHSLISLTGLPAIGQAPTSAVLWVEGWKEHIEYGVHDIEFSVSGFCRTAPPPRWDDINPAWTWDNVDPSLTWDQTVCLGPLVNLGRWSDQPATLRWQTIKPSTLTWDEYK